MAANTALREARLRARLSQDELARMIRESGFRAGRATPCSARTVQRWESGHVACPQGRYLLALESVLGQPAESLGFAAARYGMDRTRMLAEAGLDAAVPLPSPAETYGPSSGMWLSEYVYPSSGRGQDLTGRHYVMLLQRGAQLEVYSVPASKSRLRLTMSVNGAVATGTWTEETDPSGYYRGALYSGALQLLLDPTGHRFEGEWVGFGRDLKVNHGSWALTLVEASVSDESRERWNREPEDSA
jgi:transcriptional regulator with XRE-family HTH domain